MGIMLSLTIQEHLRMDLAPYVKRFFKQVGAEEEFDLERITVWADVDKFKWKEDESVWNQKKGNTQHVFSVYFDNKFVAYARMDMTEQDMVAEFWKGFLEKYELDEDNDNKIWINKEIYDIKRREKEEKERKEKEQIIKAIEDKPVINEVQEKAKEIALDVAKQSTFTK